MRCSSFHTKSHIMRVPHLYSQLQAQLSQWINPEDKRHLQVFCENIAAILQAQSACLSHWLPYLSQPFGNRFANEIVKPAATWKD